MWFCQGISCRGMMPTSGCWAKYGMSSICFCKGNVGNEKAPAWKVGIGHVLVSLRRESRFKQALFTWMEDNICPEKHWSQEQWILFCTNYYHVYSGKIWIFEKLLLHFLSFTTLLLLSLIWWIFYLGSVFCHLAR